MAFVGLNTKQYLHYEINETPKHFELLILKVKEIIKITLFIYIYMGELFSELLQSSTVTYLLLIWKFIP